MSTKALPRCAILTLLMCVTLLTPVAAQDKRAINPSTPEFPNEQEIRLVLTQAERAAVTFASAIDLEEATMKKEAANAVSKDREVLKGLRVALSALNKNPQGFNSAAAFYFVLWLDDASRNAALCASSATADAAAAAIGGNVKDAYRLLNAGQSCTGASTLLYTVSESASELYARYLKANEGLLQAGYETAQRCADILKTKKR